jgi:carboxyl-terminal processing protease
MKNAKRSLMWLAVIILSAAAFTSDLPGFISTPLAAPASKTDTGSNASVASNVVVRAFELIHQGKFEAADDLTKQAYRDPEEQLTVTARQLVRIIGEYKDIDQRRNSAREKAYEDTLADLGKLKTANADDANDVEDVNDLTEALSVIAKTREFADSEQKAKLMSDSFVKETLQDAVDRAAGFEVKGKWLEAYSNCYYWLQSIDPNNEGYSDYAEQLLDKATLAMAFEDSPCETSEERFSGVKKEMFTRAVDFLDSRYVTVVDYDKMAQEALKRCRLLSDVLGASAQFADASQTRDDSNPFMIEGLLDSQKVAVWSATLSELANEAKEASQETDGLGREDFLRIFEAVLTLNKMTIGLPSTMLIAQFAEAAMSALDPYTVIIWPKQIQDFEQMMTNEFMGIGVEISKRKGLLTVSSLLLDTPAFHSELDAGDIIEAVDGLETKDMSLGCAAKKIKGRAGTEVKLRVRRPSEDKTVEDKVFNVTITRDRITVPTVRGWQRTKEGKWLHMIDRENKIGFVRLTSFSSDTASGLERVLDQLESEGLRGLILDLRWNTGGLLDSAVDVADKFIDEGLIVKRKSLKPGRGGTTPYDYEYGHSRGTHPNYPVVILINGSSASASEIVAGALADDRYERATLVGTRTHGKGSVQGITGYPGDSAQLKYTMAYYHLPSGQRVKSKEEAKERDREDWGVGPDIEVELRSDELKKLFEVQRSNDVLVRADHDDQDKAVEKHTIEETLASDPQLAVGLLIVRSKLLHDQALALLN